ncbi:hypothetical protein PENSPDRAFT_751257 [Peniophora sp. CONT]|nr:hypothetical protein PENSPDRAFT_751257 [Peniophora sp. CONT]
MRFKLFNRLGDPSKMTEYTASSEAISVYRRKMRSIEGWTLQTPPGANPSIAPSVTSSQLSGTIDSRSISSTSYASPSKPEPNNFSLIDYSQMKPNPTMQEFEEELMRQRPPPIVPGIATAKVKRSRSSSMRHTSSTIVSGRRRASSHAPPYYPPQPSASQGSYSPQMQMTPTSSGPTSYASSYPSSPRAFANVRDSITGVPAYQRGTTPSSFVPSSYSSSPRAFANVRDSITGAPAYQRGTNSSSFVPSSYADSASTYVQPPYGSANFAYQSPSAGYATPYSQPPSLIYTPSTRNGSLPSTPRSAHGYYINNLKPKVYDLRYMEDASPSELAEYGLVRSLGPNAPGLYYASPRTQRRRLSDLLERD